MNLSFALVINGLKFFLHLCSRQTIFAHLKIEK
jgi:hypothetical protein